MIKVPGAFSEPVWYVRSCPPDPAALSAPRHMFLRAKVVAAWHVDRRTREVRREMLRTMLRLTLASVGAAIVAIGSANLLLQPLEAISTSIDRLGFPDEPGTIGDLPNDQMVTGVTKPTITIYRPAKDKNTGTAMLICPGGGYWNLYWQLEGDRRGTEWRDGAYLCPQGGRRQAYR